MEEKRKPKRDQKAYELYNKPYGKHSLDMLVVILMDIVEQLGDPYTLKPCVSGVRGYSPKVMVVVVALGERWNGGYRRTSANLRSHGDLLKRLGLPRAPSKSAICAACKGMPESYMHELNGIVTAGIVPHDVAGDSTGMSNRRKVAWFDVRADSAKTKRGWIKLHTLIDVATRVVLLMKVTEGSAGDLPPMREMLELFKGADGDATFDSAYLSRKMCTKLAALGMTPFVRPKSNTTSKSKGSHAWKMMVEMYQNSKEEFDGRYHKRSIAEAVYAAIKAMYGNALRTRIMRTQTTEAMMHAVVWCATSRW